MLDFGSACQTIGAVPTTVRERDMETKPARPNRFFDAHFDEDTPLPAHCCFASAVEMTRAIRARSCHAGKSWQRILRDSIR